LVVTDTWVIYARPRSANIVVEDIERLKARVEESEPETLPGTARRLVSLPDDTRPADGLALPLQLGTGLAQRIAETTEILGEESAFYFPKPDRQYHLSLHGDRPTRARGKPRRRRA
jgi:hypothetical protein